jgi:nucleoid-associated protein YgaU
MTELPPEVTDDGENPTVVPVGRPEAVNPTVWGLPEMVAVLMVLVAEEPATAEPEAGEAPMEKSPGGGGGVPALNRATPSAQYMVVANDPAKLWVAVEARS